MIKRYPIIVDCANCANLMEKAAGAILGVKSCTVNYFTQKIQIEFEEGQDPAQVLPQVLSACQRIDADCEIKF